MMIPDEAIDLSVKAIDLVIQWTYSDFKIRIQVTADFPKKTDKRQTDGAYPNKLWTHSRSSSFRLASSLFADLAAILTWPSLTWPSLTWPSFLTNHPTSTESAIRSGRLSPMGRECIVESPDLATPSAEAFQRRYSAHGAFLSRPQTEHSHTAMKCRSGGYFLPGCDHSGTRRSGVTSVLEP